MRMIVTMLAVAGLLAALIVGALTPRAHEASHLMTLREEYSRQPALRVDHQRFEALQRDFATPAEVTQTCVECHNLTAQQVMHGNHWNWEREEFIEGRGIVYLGKKNAINNFCIGTKGSEASCAKCHIGYGMDSEGEIFTDTLNIDCLICHDNTESYVKAAEQDGFPLETLDLSHIAQNVGQPMRSNCGSCHFYGGGGNNVKHGDLEMAMFEPDRSIDVHMASMGMNLQCTDCHTTEAHNISGKVYSLSSMNLNRNDCEQCHTGTPHADNILNEHTLKVSCQACHIPTFAKANATKMFWDWSTAGRLRNGEPFHEEDSLGNHTYLSIKGSFTWARNVTPAYIWFNGTASHYLKGDVVEDTSEVIVLNQLHGSYTDADAKIIPVKIHHARQPYDPVNRMLIQPKLFAKNKGEGAFWKDFDWQTASAKGMEESGLPFSGEIKFVRTAMYWPVNHMVADKDESLTCEACHSREDSRLAGLTDFYLPGRDRSTLLDTLGNWLLLLTFLGVATHGTIRIISHFKRETEVRK